MMKKLLPLAFVLVLSVSGFAQEPATGFPPYGSFQPGAFDTVNRESLNAHFAIPIVYRPGRGTDFRFAVVFNSLVWKRPLTYWTKAGTGKFGWNLDLVMASLTYKTWNRVCWVDRRVGAYYWITRYYDYAYTDAQGGRHEFTVDFYDDDCFGMYNTGPRTGYTDDGSGVYLNANSPAAPIATLTNGTQIKSDGTLIDRNGNKITKTIGSTTDWTDTVGRTALSIEYIGSTTVKYHVKDQDGTTRTTTVTLSPKYIKTAFACAGFIEYSGVSQEYLVTEILLPNGQSYTMEYESTPGDPTKSTGRLKKITLPTGGDYEYTYPGSNGGMNCADGSLKSLTRKITADGSTAEWTYSRAQVSSNWNTTIDAPQLAYDTARNRSVYTFNSGKQLLTTKIYKGTSTLVRTINTVWAANGTPSSDTVIEGSLQMKTETDYDDYGNLTFRSVVDWGSGAPGAYLQSLDVQYVSDSAYTNRNIRNLVKRQRVVVGGYYVSETLVSYDEGTLTSTSGVPQHDSSYSSSFTTRGNPTTISRWISGPWLTGNYVDTTLTYNDLGNVLAATDPEGHTTSISYTDDYSDGLNRSSLAYPTEITKPSPFGSQTLSSKYYYETGQVRSSTDENGNSTTSYYSDSLGRLTKTEFPDSGQVDISYNDSALTVTTTTKRTVSSSVTVSRVFNELGQLKQIQFPGGRKADLTYDPVGRPWKTTNPYVSTSDPTYGVTETQLDALGRIVKQVNQDATSSTISYSGGAQKILDETLKQRLLEVDALGRITKACEVTAGNSRSPAASCGITTYGGTGYLTIYAYTRDTSGVRHVTVTQGGQTKSSTYNPGGQLTSNKIIEVSTSTEVTYTYNDDSNLLSVTDPRGTVNLEYDQLHRLTRKKYGSTVAASYSYDGTQANNAIGRLITEKDGDFGSGADKTDYTYDAMGRIATSKRTISGTAYTTSLIYDLMGNLASLNYPRTSGTRRLVSYTYNANAEPTKATDATGAQFDYVSNATYSSLGTLQQIDFKSANIVRTSLGWNKRLLLTSLLTQKVGSTTHLSLSYSYFNNGQIQQITDNLSNLRTEKYTYDQLSRLLTAQRGPDSNIQRKYSYDFDRYGNRWVQDLVNGSGFDTSHSFNSANNRVTSSGFSHDTSGNLSANGAGTTYGYNQENFMTSAGGSISYLYDAPGRRVRKTIGSTVTDYFYVGGAVISEKQGSGWTDYILFGGQRIAQQTGSSASTANYLHADYLGSTRVTTNSSGNSTGTCDFDPYGEVQAGSSCTVQTNYRFAGAEWDAETDLHHLWFRQYDCRLGRWMGVDPLAGNNGNPQSLNRYGYVLNDPINLVDTIGLCGQSPVTRQPSVSILDARPGVGGGAFYYSPRKRADGTRTIHQAFDQRASRWQPVYPLLPGFVARTGYNEIAGNYVEISSPGDVTTRLNHLQNPFPVVGKGQEVGPNTIVGYAGSSGNAQDLPESELHVHIGLKIDKKPRDPFLFLNSPCPGKVQLAQIASGVRYGGSTGSFDSPYSLSGLLTSWILSGQYALSTASAGYDVTTSYYPARIWPTRAAE